MTTETTAYHSKKPQVTLDSASKFLADLGFSPGKRDPMLSNTKFPNRTASVAEQLRRKFRAARSYPGRYHIAVDCLYFALTESGALAESAHYFAKDNTALAGGTATQDREVVRVAINPSRTADLDKKFDRRKLVADNHVINDQITAMTQGNGKVSRVEGPSARIDGERIMAVYDFSTISVSEEVSSWSLVYNSDDGSVDCLGARRISFSMGYRCQVV